MSIRYEDLASELNRIDELMVKSESDFRNLLDNVHSKQYNNAVNLLHYLSLRSIDIRALQDALHAAGLSSLASAESHIRGQVIAISQRLGIDKTRPDDVFSFETGKLCLAQKSASLFGTKEYTNIPYIMVTFDTTMAEDFDKVKNLVLSGMNIARINCAHDHEEIWLKMIRQVKRATEETGIGCKIYMDLAGPKIRTLTRDKKKVGIKEGDRLWLVDQQHMEDGKKTIGCTVPGIAEQVKPGHRVLIDDGLIEAFVEKAEQDRIRIKILRISSGKPYIKHEKGINFPDSSLSIPALTDFDKKCLPFIVKYADLLGYSFVKQPTDLLELRELLHDNQALGLIIKIETPEAVKNLPALLFCGMKQERLGVMIARGDLAVEIGFERMSEVQEEILWICEAAHVPVIWATQVLESLNKSGVATRSEVTDASHAAMADGVMINKGEFMIRTMETLKDILLRSGGHHLKKRYTFRPLAIARRFIGT